MTNRIDDAREAVRALGDVPRQLAALEDLTVNQLAEKYQALYGEPTRTRNRGYLRKKLAWRIQELAGSGLAEHTLAKIIELGDELPERWRRRHATPLPSGTAPEDAPAAPATAPRDARLPAVGTVLTRLHDGTAHQVTVGNIGFECNGQIFKTLSAVARHITGTPWNGFVFFGLKKTGAETAEVS